MIAQHVQGHEVFEASLIIKRSPHGLTLVHIVGSGLHSKFPRGHDRQLFVEEAMHVQTYVAMCVVVTIRA